MKTALLVLTMTAALAAADAGVMRSRRAKSDFELTADPASGVWKRAKAEVTSHDRYGKPVSNARTEIRSVWTDKNLYFLFTSQYETLYLKPNPTPDKETWGLWDWDVVEVFIGHDLNNIQVYKEFEVSPQGEFVDLDVDRNKKEKSVDWMWNAGMTYKARVDEKSKTWYCEMRIPFSSIAAKAPAAGQQFRLNLYRIEGGPKERKYITWQPVHSPSYHTPEKFGRLRLDK